MRPLMVRFMMRNENNELHSGAVLGSVFTPFRNSILYIIPIHRETENFSDGDGSN